MEYIEHKTGEKAKRAIKGAGRFGPLPGALLGAFPQCGFSAAASGLYSGRIITVGTLMAVYLSTSDEMLPIFISERVPAGLILKVIGIKAVVGIITGFSLDFAAKKLAEIRGKKNADDEPQIEHLCEHDHCHCEEGIFKSSLTHTVKISVFLFLVTLVLGAVIEFAGTDALSGIITNKPVIGQALAGIVGLIPNCAASVVITKLYLEGLLSFGAMMSGLLVGAGIGLLVLFRTNDNLKKNLQILGILYAAGVFFGILIDLIGIS